MFFFYYYFINFLLYPQFHVIIDDIFFTLVEYDCHAQSMDHGQSGETDDEGIERDSVECEEVLRNNFATFDDVLEVIIIFIKTIICM